MGDLILHIPEAAADFLGVGQIQVMLLAEPEELRLEVVDLGVTRELIRMMLWEVSVVEVLHTEVQAAAQAAADIAAAAAVHREV